MAHHARHPVPGPLTRLRSLVALAAFTLAAAPCAWAQSPADVSQPSWERRPYVIQAAIQLDPASRLDRQGLDLLLAQWLQLAQRFVGPPWQITCSIEPPDLFGYPLESLDPQRLESVAPSCDQLWVIRIEPGPGDALLYRGRCLDRRTGLLDVVRGRQAPLARDIARPLLELALELFRPAAELISNQAGIVQLRVQGGSLANASPMGAVAGPLTVFEAIRRFEPRGEEPARLIPIPWTYLITQSWDPPVARCRIVSSLSDPLTTRVLGRTQILAISSRPGPEPTRLRFETPPPEPRPAAGYALFLRQAADDIPCGQLNTDRLGRATIPPGLTPTGPLLVRVVAADIEPLAEFPIMPGQRADEWLVRIDTRPETVALEARLESLRDEIVDLIAQRSRLESLIQARVEASADDDARGLLAQYRQLPGRATYQQRLDTIHNVATQRQRDEHLRILSPTAQGRLRETQSMLDNYLGDQALRAFEAALETPPPQAPRPADPSTQPPQPEAAPPGAPSSGEAAPAASAPIPPR